MNRRFASLAFVLLLTACFGLEHVERLRHAHRAPSQFEQELAQLYLGFVEEELEKYDWESAGYFAKKGTLAAEGNFAAPENPDDWNIAAHAIDELRAARVSIESKLTPAFRQSRPHIAAQLLFHYDCWVEEQEEGWETAAIESCKQQVMRHLAETDPPVPAGGPLSTSYLFHFPASEASLDGLARDELDLIARTLSAEPYAYSIVINGHAERGDEDSASLSLRRADYIRDFLTQRGLADAHITYNAFADVAADAGEQDGHRVELFIE